MKRYCCIDITTTGAFTIGTTSWSRRWLQYIHIQKNGYIRFRKEAHTTHKHGRARVAVAKLKTQQTILP